jgi:hypothetical protein
MEGGTGGVERWGDRYRQTNNEAMISLSERYNGRITRSFTRLPSSSFLASGTLFAPYFFLSVLKPVRSFSTLLNPPLPLHQPLPHPTRSHLRKCPSKPNSRPGLPLSRPMTRRISSRVWSFSLSVFVLSPLCLISHPFPGHRRLVKNSRKYGSYLCYSRRA